MSNEPQKYLAIILAPASLTEDISRVAAPASEAYFNLRIQRLPYGVPNATECRSS